METRLLSPDSLWFEMPLSLQTARLVWRAMDLCGLREGKIHPPREELPSAQQEMVVLVEGRTPKNFFITAPARVQAELCRHEGGTRVDFYAIRPDAVRPNGNFDLTAFDFGASKTFERGLLPRIKTFFEAAPVICNEAEELQKAVAPLASPDGSTSRAASQPSFELLVPIRLQLVLQQQELARLFVRLAVAAPLLLAGLTWNFAGPVLLLFAGWTWFHGRKNGRIDWNWFAVFAALGAWLSGIMLLSWG